MSKFKIGDIVIKDKCVMKIVYVSTHSYPWTDMFVGVGIKSKLRFSFNENDAELYPPAQTRLWRIINE